MSPPTYPETHREDRIRRARGGTGMYCTELEALTYVLSEIPVKTVCRISIGCACQSPKKLGVVGRSPPTRGNSFSANVRAPGYTRRGYFPPKMILKSRR